MQPTLYYPELRPDSYFTIGNIIYTSTLHKIRKFTITEKKDPTFNCVDIHDFTRHAFTYTSHQILLDHELFYIKNLIDQVQDELDLEECTSEKIYESICEKVKVGEGQFVQLFYRLSMMFIKQNSRAKLIINFIGQIKDFNI